MDRPVPVTLEGRVVRLEPLSLDHLPGLCAVGLEPELWRWTHSAVADEPAMRGYVQTALAEQAAGSALPFAVMERKTGRTIGSTRYGNVEPAHRRVEIGWTWYGREWQRTAVNTETKLLLLRHAFESLGCQRVEFKTDVLNDRSRTALGRLGAVEEAVFRKHMVTASGRVRDTVYFSIVDEEWPAVRQRLESRLEATV